MTDKPTANRKGKARLAPTIAPILFILLIGAIGVQTITSCSGDDGGGGISACKEGTVAIGAQTWQKCNSDAAPSTGNSLCYDDKESNCAIYGRLYSWAAAMALPSECDSTSCADRINKPYHRGICPSGWHIPSNAEWTALVKFVEGEKGIVDDYGYVRKGSDVCDNPNVGCVCEEPGTCYSSMTAGKYLRFASGWNNYQGISMNGVDAYGFAALPGGFATSNGSFYYIGSTGVWLSSSEYNASKVSARQMTALGYMEISWLFEDKGYLVSVRCLKD